VSREGGFCFIAEGGWMLREGRSLEASLSRVRAFGKRQISAAIYSKLSPSLLLSQSTGRDTQVQDLTPYSITTNKYINK
jgi:hypothetical protein